MKRFLLTITWPLYAPFIVLLGIIGVAILLILDRKGEL